jgi:hypothetical protein
MKKDQLDAPTYLCALGDGCDGSRPHTYEEMHEHWNSWWGEVWPEIWAFEQDRMTDIDAVLERIRLRGSISDTMGMNLRSEAFL